MNVVNTEFCDTIVIATFVLNVCIPKNTSRMKPVTICAKLGKGHILPKNTNLIYQKGIKVKKDRLVQTNGDTNNQLHNLGTQTVHTPKKQNRKYLQHIKEFLTRNGLDSRTKPRIVKSLMRLAAKEFVKNIITNVLFVINIKIKTLPKQESIINYLFITSI